MRKPRILLVDDEPDVLGALQNMLHKHRRAWEMIFVGGGEAALAELGRGPIDLVITDMRMPGMDGAELLARFRERSPQTARVILSAHAEEEAMVRALPVAHQYLSKPCDAETLRALIERTCSLRGLLGDTAARALASRLDHLPSPLGAYQKLIRAIEKPNASLAEVASIAEQDPAVSAKLLQIVNSAYFGFSRRVVSIQQAVAYLGLSLVKGLALQAHVLVSLGSLELDTALLERVQRCSMMAAQLARKFAGEPARAEAAFSAALVHGVGLVVLASGLPEGESGLAAREALRKAGGQQLADLERGLLGVTHAEVGAYLLGVWGLPQNLVEAVALHQEPRELPEGDARTVAAVHVAAAFSDAQVSGRSLDEAWIDLDFLERVGFQGELPRWRLDAQGMLPGLEKKGP